jgi:hypothetical protein
VDGFESQTSQISSHFFPIPSNPCVLGITEQALTRNFQHSTYPFIYPGYHAPIVDIGGATTFNILLETPKLIALASQ